MKTLCTLGVFVVGIAVIGCGGGGGSTQGGTTGGTTGSTGIPAAYTLTDLGMLPGGSWVVPSGDNAAGTVVGFADFHGLATTAVKWQAGTITDIGPHGAFSSAQAVDPTGTFVVGQNQPTGGDAVHAALFTGGSATDLTPTATTTSYARGVNAAGQVVGYIQNGPAFLWQNGIRQSLGPTGSIADAINDSGQVVGSVPVGGRAHAALWQNGGQTDLGTLPGGSTGQSVAIAVNSTGQVVGSSDCSGGTHAFLYDHGTMIDLGSLSGKSSALAINDSGFVVGDYAITTFSVKPCIWYKGSVKDLNSLVTGNPGITVGQPVGISSTGVIVATAVVNGQNHAVLLTPAR